jgi:hypothetical protein
LKKGSVEPGQKTVIRILRVLKRGPADMVEAAEPRSIMLEGEDGRRCVVSKALLEALVQRGLITRKAGTVFLTAPGKSLIDGTPVGTEGYHDQHRELQTMEIDVGGHEQQAAINLAESPLAAIARRKDRSGRKFLEEAHLLAGERLRADFTRGSMSPQLGVNWQAAGANAGRSGNSGGMAELTDAALSARLRVEKAVEAVGPELSGVLLDCCCFLKGMEWIESERGWPPRSAKILLKTALGILARHYGYSTRATSSRHAGRIVHWGGEGYRPTLDGR